MSPTAEFSLPETTPQNRINGQYNSTQCSTVLTQAAIPATFQADPPTAGEPIEVSCLRSFRAILLSLITLQCPCSFCCITCQVYEECTSWQYNFTILYRWECPSGVSLSYFASAQVQDPVLFKKLHSYLKICSCKSALDLHSSFYL